MSERLITVPNADLKTLYNLALTSQGTGLISSGALKSLLLYAQDNAATPTILECYRLKDGLEIPTPEYGFSYPLYQQISQGLSKPAQAALMIAELNSTLDLLKDEPDPVGFEVWFE